MREINTHKINYLNKSLTIKVMDPPNKGGASHTYMISWKNRKGAIDGMTIFFQAGLPPGVGINGISNEVLLAIVRDRLECFQAGKFACEENAKALESVKEALLVLEDRTKDRISRGVDDTYNK